MTTTFRMQLLAGAVALALVSVMVVRTSSAVFSDTTATDGSWTAGTVTLTGDDGTAAATSSLTVSGIRPGDSGYDCIEVTYGGSLTGADLDADGVVLYASAVGDSDGSGTDTGTGIGLSDDLQMTVEVTDATTYNALALTDPCDSWVVGTTGTSVFATGSLSTMGTTYAAAHGTGTWVPSAQNQTFVYRVDWSLPTATGNDAQGDGSTATFTWEVRSTSA